VAERARLYGRPVIATRVGGLADQIGEHPGNVVVDDNAGLVAAMAAAVGGTAPSTGTASSWEFDGPIDRDTVMAEITRRAAAQRGVRLKPIAPGSTRSPSAGVPQHVATPLRRLPSVPPPPPTSARPGVSTVKRLIRRVIAWEVDPLRQQLVELQQASVKAAETADARIDEVAEELDER
jgi:hypothetical protein